MKNNNTQSVKRKDKKGRILRTGETQEASGRYRYSYTVNGKQDSKYSWKLEETDRLPAGKRPCKALRTIEKEIQELINAGVLVNKITVLKFVETYLKIADVGLKRKTVRRHQDALKLLRKQDLFCNRKIVDLQIMDMKQFFLGLAEKGISYDAIENLKKVLGPAFRLAYEDRTIALNPMNFNFSDLMSRKTTTRPALTIKQRDFFLNFLKNDNHFCKYYEAIYILFHTGMRISEFCGLTPKNIDFDEMTITIDHQLLYDDRAGERYIETPKSESGYRTLPMTEDVAECFRILIARSAERKIEPMVGRYRGFMLLAKHGTAPMTCNDWVRRFYNIRQKFEKTYPGYKMPHITAHVCRHTYCTEMAMSGMPPKALQYLMGHENISTTLDVYAHIQTENIRDAVLKASGYNA